MRCAEVREKVAPLLDGELDLSATRLVEAHLDTCAECAGFVRRLARQPLGPPRRGAGVEGDPAFWDAMDRALAIEAARPEGRVSRGLRWFRGELRLSRGMALLYLLILAFALAFGAWGVRAPELPLESVATPPSETPKSVGGRDADPFVPVSTGSRRQVY
jgi:anti-sigma factor RsiW